jgi:hypothetical protein
MSSLLIRPGGAMAVGMALAAAEPFLFSSDMWFDPLSARLGVGLLITHCSSVPVDPT